MANALTTGIGLDYPLRREHGDYATVSGAALIGANIRKILGVSAASPDGATRGVYPWRLDFGSQIRRALHSDLDDGIARDLVQVYVIDAIERWEPRAIITRVSVTLEDLSAGRRAVIAITYQLDTDQLGRVPAPTIEVLVG